MDDPPRARFDRAAPYPGAPFQLSRLAFSVPTSARAGLGGPLVGLLRQAHRAGVTTFDLTAAEDPRAAETLLAAALPGTDASVVVIVPSPEARTARGPPGPGPWPAPPPSATATASSRVPGFPRLIELSSPEGSSPTTEPAATVAATSRGRTTAPFAVRCASRDDVRRAVARHGPCLISGAFSLLKRSLLTGAVDAHAGEILGWIARDPFAGGRLDGSRFAGAGGAARPGPPPSLRELNAEFAPVAPLRFLARRGERTLAQAALWFARAGPRVVSVVAPLPVPERWREIAEFDRAPSLTGEELARIERVPELASPGP